MLLHPFNHNYPLRRQNGVTATTGRTVAIGAASESLNEWADEEAGLEAIQKILDSLDDIIALQDANCDPDMLAGMLRDVKLHELLQVIEVFSFRMDPPCMCVSLCWCLCTKTRRIVV